MVVVTHVIFSHVSSLHMLKAKGTKSANEMGSFQEYNVRNMISKGTNILCRDFSTLIPILKKSITAFPYRLLQHRPRMTETSLRARQTWKSWIVNQDKMTQKFLHSLAFSQWPVRKGSGWCHRYLSLCAAPVVLVSLICATMGECT